MKTRFLFPYKYKLIGWIMLVPSALFGIIKVITDFQFPFLDVNVFSLTTETFGETNSHWFKNNITDEITAVIFTVGAILAGFSKEKDEDEYISVIRLESLLWATYVNYAVLIFSMLLIYDAGFFTVMIFNMFTVLIIFLLRFNFMLYKTKTSLADEK